MNREIPLEITQLRRRLLEVFQTQLPEANSGTPEERERNLLSRALAAFTIQRLSQCSIKDAVDSLVDGRADGGIDAVHYDRASSTLWVIQSKYIAGGVGEPSLGDVQKFTTGLDNLLNGRFERFAANEYWARKENILIKCFANPLMQIQAVMVYTSFNLVSEDRLWLFEDLNRAFTKSDSDNYFNFKPCNLSTLHDWITGADQGPGVPEVKLKLRNPGWIKQPYETLYGLISLEELAELQLKHGTRLVGANIRCYKGNTEVNKQILATISNEPQHFFYLNNGLTAYCERLAVNNLDRNNTEEKNITASGFSIVNGAQTLGSVTEFFRALKDSAPKGYVFLKVISLKGCEDDRVFSERITRSTNFQNQVGVQDFVALDEQQKRIANQLKLSDIHYHYKERHDMPSPDNSNFTLDEATAACACLDQSVSCDLVSRVLSDKHSLWSWEPIYPYSELNSSRYSRVFKPERSARTIWRAVQTQRVVLEKMQENARNNIDPRKEFFEHSVWMVLNILFLKLHPEKGSDLTLSDSLILDINDKTTEIVEILWDTCQEYDFINESTKYDSVFSSATHCSVLRNMTLKKLAA